MGTAIYGEWLDGTGKDRIERFNISKLETLAFRDGAAYVSALVLQDGKEGVPELLEVLEELLSAGLCDLCYEDPCDPSVCECHCHKRQEMAIARAHAAIAKEAASE
jgi:hypothetical protein